MDEYIKHWLLIIEGMQNDNTYKPAWGRAIVEICSFRESLDNVVEISFIEIAEIILKYYWNQTCFFNLSQGPRNHTPTLQNETTDLMNHYRTTINSTIPDWFEKAKPVLNSDRVFYELAIKRIAQVLKRDVCEKFMNVNGTKVPLYVLNKREMKIVFTGKQVNAIREHNFILSQLLNYRWAQLLEKFNQSPRIVSKVKGMSEEKIRRSNLTRFKEALLKEYPNGQILDFYTGNLLDPNDYTLDHVIPWSFMYSDDIWNLVITSKRNNSSKRNSVPSEEIIERLKQRNRVLVESLNGSFKEELEEANKNNLVSKYYYSLRM
ncbi:MAG: HNH endonuclease domain-containing protein [Erysipelotrichaceae bacterium]